MKRLTKTRPAKHVVFYIEDWHKWRAIPALASAISFLEGAALFCTVDKITRASEAKRGRPPVWTNDMRLHAWHAIETKRLAARAKDLQPLLMKLFARSGYRLVVHIDGAPGERVKRVEIANAQTARRLYTEAQKLMKDDPQLAARWREMAKRHAAKRRVRKL